MTRSFSQTLLKQLAQLAEECVMIPINVPQRLWVWGSQVQAGGSTSGYRVGNGCMGCSSARLSRSAARTELSPAHRFPFPPPLSTKRARRGDRRVTRGATRDPPGERRANSDLRSAGSGCRSPARGRARNGAGGADRSERGGQSGAVGTDQTAGDR